MFYPTQDSTGFERSDKYLWYDQYHEDNISSVDKHKNIILHEDCVNISNENNAQYIPFEMDRYYQGIDLMDMTLQIYFVNEKMGANKATPINVSYSTNRIRFGWLVDRNATFVSGQLLFEIRAYGTVGEGEMKEDYIWKTHINSQITILKSLLGTDIFKPTQDWYNDLLIAINAAMNTSIASEAVAVASSEAAASSAVAAKISEQNAAQSAASVLNTHVQSANSALEAQSWAVGGTGTRTGEDTNNAKYWSDRAKPVDWFDF